jgi:hypothetical protein
MRLAENNSEVFSIIIIVSRVVDSTIQKQNKTKQNETKQNETKRNETKETKQNNDFFCLYCTSQVYVLQYCWQLEFSSSEHF